MTSSALTFWGLWPCLQDLYNAGCNNNTSIIHHAVKGNAIKLVNHHGGYFNRLVMVYT